MISFQNVNKHYGDFHVLKQINLQIEKVKSSSLSAHQVPEKALCSDASTGWRRLTKEHLP